MHEQFGHFKNQLDQIRSILSQLELLRPVNEVALMETIKMAIQLQDELVKTAIPLIDNKSFENFRSLEEIAQAVASIQSAKKESITAWNNLLAGFEQELERCEYRSHVKRIREAGIETIRVAKLMLTSFLNDDECRVLMLPWFSQWGSTLKAIKEVEVHADSLASWPEKAEPIKELLYCLPDVHFHVSDIEEEQKQDLTVDPKMDPEFIVLKQTANSHDQSSIDNDTKNESVEFEAFNDDITPVSSIVNVEVADSDGITNSKVEFNVNEAKTCDLKESLHNEDVLGDRPITTEHAVQVHIEPSIASIGFREATAEDHPNRIAQVENAFWQAVSKERLGLAYYIVVAAGNCKFGVSLPMPEMISFAALADSADNASEELILKLQDVIMQIQEVSHRWNWEERVLVAAVALQPALLAPETEAAALLSSIQIPNEELPSFASICRAVLGFANLRRKIDVGMLAGICELDKWEERLNVAKQDILDWVKHEKQSEVIYAPSTDVWRKWLDISGPLGAIAAAIGEGLNTAQQKAKSFILDWNDQRHVEEECFRLDQILRGRGAQRRQIEARALVTLKKRVKIYREKLISWLQIKDARPGHVDDFITQSISECRSSIQKYLSSAEKELVDLQAKSTGNRRKSAVITVVLGRLKAIDRLFGGDTKNLFVRGPYQMVLNKDLALIANLDWIPDSTEFARHWGIEELDALISATTDPLSIQSAFAAQLKERNFEAASWLLEQMAEDSLAQQELDELRGLFDHEKERAIHQIDEQSCKVMDSIESAVCYDLINEVERGAYTAKVASIRALSKKSLGVRACMRELDELKRGLKLRSENRLAQARCRFDSLPKKPIDEIDLGLVEDSLQRGDFATAEEFINLLEDGQSIQSYRKGESNNSIATEFVQYVFDFEELNRVKQQRVPEWLELLENGNSTFGPKLRGEQDTSPAISRKEFLIRWKNLRKSDRDMEKSATHLKELMEHLGFSAVRKPQIKKINDSVWNCSLEVNPFEDKRVCRIPQFASLPKGRYQIFGCSESPKDDGIDRLIQALQLKKEYSDQAVIVIYLGQLTPKKRSRIRQNAFGKTPFLLFDEILLSFLVNREGNPLHNFFTCTLALSSGKPYTSTASYVASEMFFGRESEYKDILSRDGTNLVFGGRQLGKSVLLREIERREHSEQLGSIVRWIDLKNEQIGTILPPSDIWKVIGESLFKASVFQQPTSAAETICKNVKSWLDEGDQRRIVLLLDEADGFLEQDSKAGDKGHGFPVLSRLKGLMDSSDRRFKVVFAGLHNVQRAAKDYNTPIAHLGKPLNIGPLLANGQWREARDLVVEPFRNLGFRFAEESLPIRILSHTNFYPSLIQIFCKHLLTRLYDRRWLAADLEKAPWLEIRSEDIDQVYKSEDLQQEIKSRFELTLDLDKRYRLLALLIAQITNDAQDSGEPIEGVTRGRLREDALSWWSAGFASDPSFNRFEIILDEMIGLGVLRDAGEGKYALRSANVLNLLGSRSKIDEMLLDVSKLAPPPVYSASSFHRNLTKDPRRRSPLTAEDESRLTQKSNDVVLISGCKLSGIAKVVDGIKCLETSDIFVDLAPAKSTRQSFTDWLTKLSSRDADGLRIGIVDADDFDLGYLRDTQDFLKKKTAARKRFTKVVFLADPIRLFHLLEDDREFEGDWIRLGKWTEDFLARWLEDNGFQRDANTVSSILTETSGWGELLSEFGEACRNSEHKWSDRLQMLSANWPSKIIELDWLQIPNLQKPVLQRWVEFAGEDSIDGATLNELATESEVELFIRWAEELGFIGRTNVDCWNVDPVIVRAIDRKK
jgi:hypothetical protein